MAYFENSNGSGRAYRCSQEGSSTCNNIMNSINLYSGAVLLPLSLAYLEGRDGLSLSLKATYRSGQSSFMNQCNRDSVGSILGTGWSMPLACISVRDRAVKQGYHSDFYLIGEGGEYPLYRIGKTDDKVEFFSLEHPLWKFFYCCIDTKEYWEIYKEDGSVSIFGGSEDSTEIGLSWDNWSGPVLANGGESYPVGWYLSKIISYNKSSLSCEYENVQIALGDKSYTRTMRLKKLVSTYNQQIKLCYLPKEKFEYELPHQDLNGSNAYQFLFEDQYLDHIEVYNSEDALMYTQKLTYQFYSINNGEQKRFLTQVQQVAPQGKQMPPLCLEYFGNDENPGSLRRVTYPTGEKLTYTYHVEEFPNSNESIEIFNNDPDWKVKTTSGNDFIVLTANRENDFRLKVYFWDMEWRCFEDTSFEGQPINDASIYMGNGFFAVRYLSLTYGIYALRLFKRSPVRRYDWETVDILLENEQDAPAVTCGSDFIAIQYCRKNCLKIFQFNYTDNQWHEFDLAVESLDFQALGSGKGFIFGAYGKKDENRLILRSFYADENHIWQNGDSTDLAIDVNWEFVNPDYVWSIGSCQSCATFVSLNNMESVKASMVLLRWRDRFVFAGIEKCEVEQGLDVKNPVLFTVTTGSVIGFAQNVFRYTPKGWNPFRLLTPQSGGEYRYSYGSDLALAVENLNGRQRFYSIKFDPYLQEWVQEGAPFVEDLYNLPYICQPLVAGEYAVLGRYIFARDTKDNWKNIGYFPEQADLSTVQIDPQGGYLLYQLLDQSTVYQLPIINHQIGEPTIFEGQCCQTKDGTVLKAGVNSFITYSSAGQLPSFRFHQLFQGQYLKKRSLALVSSAVLDSGFDLQSFFFSYSLDDARLEGDTAAFHKLRVNPVDVDGKYGSTEYVYFNGATPDQIEYPEDDQFSNARAFYSHFAGRLYCTRVFDNMGQLTSGSVNWMRAIDTNGFFICQTKLSKQSWLLPYNVEKGAADGPVQMLEEIMEQEYEPKFFQKRKITKVGRDASGNSARISQTFRYGWEEYQELLDAHLLTEVVETVKSEEVSGEILEVTRIVYQPFNDGRWQQAETWIWDGTGDVTKLGDNWILQSKTLQYDQYGQPISETDEDGIINCRIYDSSSSMVVAEFSDARPEEVIYYGCEPYEITDKRIAIYDTENEVLKEKAGPDKTVELFTEEECFSGTRCLCLNQGNYLAFHLPNISCNYLLNFAAKTESTFEIHYHLGQTEFSKTVTSTKGVWQRVSLPILLPSGSTSDLVIEIHGNGKLLLDAMFLTPLTCKATACVYTSDWMLQTAKHVNNGVGLRTFYNALHSPILTTGDDNNFISYTRHRLGITEKMANAPNEALSIQMPEGGSFYSMEQGNDFTTHWNTDGQWKISGHKLVSTSGQDICLTYKEKVGPDFSLYITAFQGGASIHSGTLQIKTEGGFWVLYENESKIADAVLENEGQYLFVRIGNRVQFSCNEKILFSYLSTESNQDSLTILIPSGCAIGDLGLCLRPKVTVTYTDYTGRPLQDQVVTETGVIVGQTLYTPLGQQGVTTKEAGFDNNIWQYRTNFVKSFDWETGIIEGEINNYYPEDEGFPYVRTKTTISPDPVTREFGQAGKDLAIKGENDKTVCLGKYTNGKMPISLPAGQYYVDIVCDPDQKETIQVKDGFGRLCYEIIQNRSDGLRQITDYKYDWNGNPVKIYYPNYFEERPDKEQFVGLLRYDSMGRIAQRSEPDMGTVQSIYNRMGKLRFLKPASATDWFIYHTYDRFGREIEIGHCNCRWDEQKLRIQAEQSDFIPEPSIATRRMFYDGDGTDLNMLGQIWKCITYGPEGTTEESYKYDNLGNVTRYAQTTGEHTDVVFMEYDKHGKLTCQYFDDKKEFLVCYHNDLQERLVQIDFGNSPVYRCSYDAAGNLASEVYAPDAKGEAVREYEYSSAQWLTNIKDPFFNQKIQYFKEDQTGRFGGQITEVTSVFTGDLPQGVYQKVQMNYQYDGLGRLVSADFINGEQRDLISGTTYDINGNLLKYNDRVFGYGTGTNRLLTINGDQYSYDANGAAISASVHGIEKINYDKVLQTAETVQTRKDIRTYQQGSTGISAYHDSNGIYYCLRDLQGRLLQETRPDGSKAICLYGVNGLFAQILNSKIYYYIKDYQSSIRGIYDGSKLCAAYHYTPFGGFMGDVWETEEIKRLIQFGFTGQILEETGIYRLKSRLYDPFCGRFLSMDPEGQYSSPYLYGGSDWINYFDPDGAWSWGAFGAGLGGFCLIVIGGALSVASAGIGSPVGACIAGAGASFLIGAGIGGTIYGITSQINGDFSIDDCLIQMGMGGLFAMVGATAGAALPAGFTMFGLSAATSATIVDIGVGVVIGGTDGLVTNGLLNVAHGESFLENVAVNTVVGCAMGGLMSGLTGLGSGMRNGKVMRGGVNRKISISKLNCDGKVKHSSIWKLRGNAVVDGQDLVRVEGNNRCAIRQLDHNLFHGRHVSNAEIKVPQGVYDNINIRLANGAPDLELNRHFSYFTNNCCSGYVITKLAEGGLSAPLWARTPTTLYWWGKLLGSFQ